MCSYEYTCVHVRVSSKIHVCMFLLLQVFVVIYVTTKTCSNKEIHTCILLDTRTRTHVYSYEHICKDEDFQWCVVTYVFLWIYVCMCTCICMHQHTCAHIFVPANSGGCCLYTCVYMNIHVYLYMYPFKKIRVTLCCWQLWSLLSTQMCLYEYTCLYA